MDKFFYAPPELFSDTGDVLLPHDEAKHAIKALRLKIGDEIIVIDGQGVAARVQIEFIDRKAVRGQVLSRHSNLGEPTLSLTIGLSLLNRQRRYDMFLEKAVELGVTSIIPMITARTQHRGNWREDRAIHMITAATKQCQRSKFPELRQPTSFEESLTERTLIADHRARISINEAIDPFDDSLRILVGPEGGFTDEERKFAIHNGAILVHLGPRRLRSETAAICCANAVMLARL